MTNLNFDSQDEELDFYRGMSDHLMEVIYHAWDHLTDIDPPDRAHRVDLAIEILDEIVEPMLDDEDDDEDESHPTVTMHVPEHLRSELLDESPEAEVDELLVPIIQALWDNFIVTWFCCQGDEDSTHGTGYIHGPGDVSLNSLMDILKPFNLEVTEFKIDNHDDKNNGKSWLIRFNAITEKNLVK